MSRSARKPPAEEEIERLQLAVNQLVQNCDDLEHARNYYRTLFDEQPVGRIVFNGSGVVTVANEVAVGLLQRPLHAVIGKPFIVFVSESYRRTFVEHLRKARAAFPGTVKDTIDVGSAERRIPVELVTRAFKRNGTVECDTAVLPVPELRESGSGAFGPLLSRANDAIIVRTLDGRILGWNRAAEQLYGYSEREVLGANLLNLLGPNPLSLFKESELVLASTGKWAGTLALRRRDGTRVEIESRAALIRAGDGSPHSVVQIDRDVTARHAADIALRARLRREETRAQPGLGDLATALSCEVQEPLRGLVGYLELLQSRYRGKAGREADEFAVLALEEAGRLQAMLDDIRLYCRAASGDTEPVRIPLADALQEALARLRPAVAATGANIRHGDLPAARVAPSQLVEVMTRILSNALKFRNAKAVEIAVKARPAGPMLEVAVTDNGIGIPASERDRLFRPFGRLHTVEEYPGRGMGLAIARRIVERWGGRIRFESRPGEGSTFSFTVPAETPAEDETTAR